VGYLSSTSGTQFKGEFTLSIKLIRERGEWFLATAIDNSTFAKPIPVSQPMGDWLSEPDSPREASHVSADKQKAMERGRLIVLLHLSSSFRPRSPDALPRRNPLDPADGIVIWIEQDED
jgi:hypothetical protein